MNVFDIKYGESFKNLFAKEKIFHCSVELGDRKTNNNLTFKIEGSNERILITEQLGWPDLCVKI